MSDQEFFARPEKVYNPSTRTFVERPQRVLRRLDHGAEFPRSPSPGVAAAPPWAAPTEAKALQASPYLEALLRKQCPELVRREPAQSEPANEEAL